MLLHVIPQLYATPFEAPGAQLVDFVSTDLGLHLRVEEDLVARRPYPNKNYLVACRRGRKAVSGFFVETQGHVSAFTTHTRWSYLNLKGGRDVVTHEVRHLVLDDEMDAITESMVLWYSIGKGWQDRCPAWARRDTRITPAAAQPRMEIVPCADRQGHFTDCLEAGLIVHRVEIFPVPTVERARLENRSLFSDDWRLPPPEHVFQATL